MFAGGGADSESVFSTDSRAARLHRSKSAVQPSTRPHPHFQASNPFLDPVEAAARVSLIEEEFGWSGSVGGIRGRDDRQIERDVEYERKMAERTRKRHERKLARQQALNPPSTPTGGGERSPGPKRPVFAPTEGDMRRVDELTTGAADTKPSGGLSPPAAKLNRGKSLRDKVEAALGRWNSLAPAAAASKKNARSQSVSAIDHPKPFPSPHHHHHYEPPMVERKEGFGALARRISKKLTIEDQERRRRERLELAYAEPPVLSHTLLKYGEAHTDYSLNPFRRRQTTSHPRALPADPPQDPKPR
ncbi:hypothetical protein PtA15_6A514 [Puccinia triticina]|uniref:TPX2 C-terminal domain-containing protein n=1 Tax=Puccinia triticina TaxID=208348 RepID=A0ABY7CLC7_9BASI|nr:uncharacterized protein PtA15_6A514 [Puccinia triticina]WAQ85885.1 hypothetical protein PtA15_6A514 [Puccinia triticina]WAR55779.1 hypothetical protein PtB15_6B522 [Puccinia triticina]